MQELYFIMSGTLSLTLSFNLDGDTRLSRPEEQQSAANTVERVFSYGPGAQSIAIVFGTFSDFT